LARLRSMLPDALLLSLSLSLLDASFLCRFLRNNNEGVSAAPQKRIPATHLSCLDLCFLCFFSLPIAPSGWRAPSFADVAQIER